MGTKLTALTEVADPASTDILYIVTDPGGTPVSKKVTVANLLAGETVTGSLTLTGDLGVNGGDITSTATTFNLLNATVTTLNIGGAATAIALGAASTVLTLGSNARINGGAAANDDLTLQGTSHATRTTSYIILQPNGGNVGIGTTLPGSVAPGTASPAYNAGKVLEIGGSDSTDPGLFLRDAGTGATGLDMWLDTTGAHGYFDSRLDSATIRSFNFRTRTVGTPINALTILGSGNVGIGTTLPGGGTTVGTAVLSLANGTTPVGGVANQVSLYSADVAASAELFALDEAGNTPQLTPHPTDFLNTLPLEGREYPWAYRSTNCYLGQQIDVDMMGAIREIEKLSGKQFIYLLDLPPETRSDWDTEQEARRIERETAIATAGALVVSLDERISAEMDPARKTELVRERNEVKIPSMYQKKALPQWLKDRGAKSLIQ